MHRCKVAALALSLSLCPAVVAQTWTPLTHQPSVRMGGYFLLMDGRVLANEMASGGLGTTNWWTLTPDAQGSYKNGTWTQVGSTVYTHLYFASTITPAGKVLVAGGEYSTGGSETNKCELFDPVTNTWSQVTPPSGWANIGDAPAATLPDGRMIMGDIFSSRTAIYNPTTNSFSAGPNKGNSRTTEETWVTMPDGSVTTWDCFGHPAAERYLPNTNQWVTAGSVPVDLVLPGSYETGAGIVLGDGRMFAIGGTPHTAFYQQPAVFNQPGTWTAGPNPPLVNGFTIGAEDAPATLMPNGHVMMPLGRVSANGGNFYAPTYFHEYDGNTINRISDPPNSSGPPYVGRLLLLPTGELLWTDGSTGAYLASGGTPTAAWKPTITNAPASITQGQSYTLTGTQFTGVSNAASYGDEYDPSTNYPIVRLTNPGNGNVYYGRTFDVNTRQIRLGNTPMTTTFVFGNNVPNGSYQLSVVANGIPSDPVNIQVGAGGGNMSITVAGACPGRITVRWSGAAPNSTVALIFAKNTGSFVIPYGPCQGTTLGLGNQAIRLVGTFASDASGTGSHSGNAGAAACHAYLQMHDIPNCTLSNVGQIQ